MVSFEAGLQAGYVEQGFDRFGPEPVWEFMFQANQEILQLRRKLADLEQAVAAGDEEALAAYARATQRYEYLDGYHYETNLKKVLFGLAFPESMWQQPAASLSGGQKTRLMLAAALVSSPDFFILDEPTNHLDIVMMEWLEQYLREFRGGLLVVSHDRAFLDNVATRILEMEGGRLRSFRATIPGISRKKKSRSKRNRRRTRPSRTLLPRKRPTSAASRPGSRVRWPGDASPAWTGWNVWKNRWKMKLSRFGCRRRRSALTACSSWIT